MHRRGTQQRRGGRHLRREKLDGFERSNHIIRVKRDTGSLFRPQRSSHSPLCPQMVPQGGPRISAHLESVVRPFQYERGGLRPGGAGVCARLILLIRGIEHD